MKRIKKSSDTYTAYAKGGGKVAKTPAQKKFAALAAPKDKITFADKIAGAKKGKAKGGAKMKKANMGAAMTKMANMKKGGKTNTILKKGGKMDKCRGGCY